MGGITQSFNLVTGTGLSGAGTSASPLTNSGVTSFDGSGGAITNQYVGVGQTWQNVTGSRTTGTTYTNSTGKPIMVAISAGTATLAYTINGIAFSTVATSYGQCSFVVPNGITYSVTNNFVTWAELR